MKSVNPYLIFNGNALEAFTFYQSAFGGELTKVRFRDMPGSGNFSEDELDRMAHIAINFGDGQYLMASDSTKGTEANLVENAGFNVCIEPESREEAEQVYQKLTAGGKILMPLEKADWAELAAMFTDKFGVQWIISYGEGEM